MICDISHRTLYRYSSPVAQSLHAMHLAPRLVPHQDIKHHSLLIEPAPTLRSDFIDSFDNPTSILEIDDDHDELVIHARSTIEVRVPASVNRAASLAWDQVRAKLLSQRPLDLTVLPYVMASRHTPASPALYSYAAPSFRPGRPFLEAVWDLNHRIHTDFTFDPTATDVSTPISKVLSMRRGVCQDFSHLALGCLRSLRLPARYVSGYLMTRPPPGQAKLRGADATHAWISVWAPGVGWVDFDPTNDMIPKGDHITFAWGRDYDDIAPISGVLLGGGRHVVRVGVDVSEAGTG